MKDTDHDPIKICQGPAGHSMDEGVTVYPCNKRELAQSEEEVIMS